MFKNLHKQIIMQVLFAIMTSVFSQWTLPDTALKMNKTGKCQHLSILVLVLDEFSVRQISFPHNSVRNSDVWSPSDLHKIPFLKANLLLSLKLGASIQLSSRWAGLPQNQVDCHSKNLLSWLMFLFKFYTHCSYAKQVSGSSHFYDIY